MSARKSDNVDKLSFDKAMAELEELVEQIESGQIGLEDALKQYERGVALIRRCRGVLNQAEQRVRQLSERDQGLQLDDSAEPEPEASEPPAEDEPPQDE